MADFLLLMHDDTAAPVDDEAWGPYLAGLRSVGLFEGGSAIGGGVTRRATAAPGPLSSHLAGFIRVQADDLEHAARLLAGNPVYDAGGTVEIRALPRDD
ncbi:MAG: hypothetical protein ACOYM5_08385 [Caulobacter sp.]